MAIDYYRPNVSGLTIYVEHLSEALARRGHTVSVLTNRHLPDLPLESRENGVRIVRAPVLAQVGKALVAPAILARALAELPRSDVLHLHSPAANAIPISLLAAALRVPIVITYHCDLQLPASGGPAPREVLAQASQNFALDRADRVITYTEDYARHTAPLADRLEKVGWILPPVTDPPRTGRGAAEARKRYGIRGKPVILFLGRFAEEKGLPHLLTAFAQVRRRFPEAIAPARRCEAGRRGNGLGARRSPARPIRRRASSRRASFRRRRSRTSSRSPTCSRCRRSTPPSRSASSRWRRCSRACRWSPPTFPACVNRPGSPAWARSPASATPPISRGRSSGCSKSPERYRRDAAEIRAIFPPEKTLDFYESIYRSLAGGPR